MRADGSSLFMKNFDFVRSLDGEDQYKALAFIRYQNPVRIPNTYDLLLSEAYTGNGTIKLTGEFFWSLYLMVLRGIFGPKTDGIIGEWRKLLKRSLMIFTAHPILFG